MSLTEKIVKELVKLEPKEFEVLWAEVVDKIDSMSRLRKRNLERLVRAAIKGRNK